eukprot:14522770-Ditylum_brightwellii.AAC.1
MGFKQYKVDQCVWKKDGLAIIVHVDDCLIFGSSKDEANKVVKDLRKRFDITDDSTTIEAYLGVKTNHNKDGSIRMYQHHLVQLIITAIPGLENTNEHIILASISITLTTDKNGSKKRRHGNADQ